MLNAAWRTLREGLRGLGDGDLGDGVAGLSTNSQCPPIGTVNNDNENWRESWAKLGLGLAFVLVGNGGNGSWWTMSAAGGSGVPHPYRCISRPNRCNFLKLFFGGGAGNVANVEVLPVPMLPVANAAARAARR